MFAIQKWEYNNYNCIVPPRLLVLGLTLIRVTLYSLIHSLDWARETLTLTPVLFN